MLDLYYLLLDTLRQGGPVVMALAWLNLGLWFLLWHRLAVLLLGQHSPVQHARQTQLSLLLIRTLINLCPLFGLLGTVMGMIQVFDTLAISGNVQLQRLTTGIAQATLPTMIAMGIALLGLIGQSALSGYSHHRLQQLSQRSL